MPVTHNPSSGVPLNHYTHKVINENRQAKLIDKGTPLNRHERRKLERKLSKRINRSNVLDGGYYDGF